MWRKATFGAAAAAGLVVGAHEAATAAPPSRWDRQPTAEQKVAALPAASRAEPNGRAVMRCKLDAARRLAGCRLVHESRGGQGYGAALLSLAPFYQMSAEAARTEAAQGDVTVVEDWFGADTPPAWLRKPTPAEIRGVWPTKAMERGIGGKAVINCAITVQGLAVDCVTVWESPPGYDFGMAAIAITPQLLFTPARRKGQPVTSAASIPINFEGSPRADGADARQVMNVAIAWAEAPTVAEVAAAYPPEARAVRLAGHATLQCDLRRDGRLTDCTTLLEQPGGKGFARAAKALARRFRADMPANAKPATVTLPFTFDPASLESADLLGAPQWVRLPAVEDLTTAFKGITGSGMLRTLMACTVQPGGGVGDCSVISEDPPGTGLGRAALALAPQFRLSTWTSAGLPTVGGRVRIPLRYDVREVEPAASPAARP